jgi:hypothetical protein
MELLFQLNPILSLIAVDEGPPGGDGIKSIVNCSTVVSNYIRWN